MSSGWISVTSTSSWSVDCATPSPAAGVAATNFGFDEPPASPSAASTPTTDKTTTTMITTMSPVRARFLLFVVGAVGAVGATVAPQGEGMTVVRAALVGVGVVGGGVAVVPAAVGPAVGTPLGDAVGADDGGAIDVAVGAGIGAAVGRTDGVGVGAADGTGDGVGVGENVSTETDTTDADDIERRRWPSSSSPFAEAEPSRRWSSAVAKSTIATVSEPSTTDAFSTFVTCCRVPNHVRM